MKTVNLGKKLFVSGEWLGILFILLSLTMPQLAQALSWNPSSGPYGGGIGSLAIDPANSSNLYAGTLGGEVFTSTDSGANWSASVSDLGGKAVNSIAIDPAASSTLYAGTSGGVYKSSDGGLNWSVSGITTQYVNELVVDPSAPNILYAGTNGGVFKSTDSGASWSASNTGLTFTSVQSIVIDPATPGTLYVGVYGGVFKSINGGASWNSSSIGLSSQNILSLAIDPDAPSTLYAGTLASGVNKSIDGGASWSPSGLSGQNVYSIAVDPNATSTLYAGTSGGGAFYSTDSGASWNNTTAGLTATDVRSIAVDPVTSSTVYVGTKIGEGIFKSTDSGANWSTSNTGLTSLTVNALTLDPTVSTTLYAGTSSGGVFKSPDRGANWSASSTGLGNLTVYSLINDPVTPSTFYAATSSGGVFKSTDSGGSWSTSNSGLTSLNVNSLAIDPLTPSRIYAATLGGGVFVSTNGGATWSPPNASLSNKFVRALAIDPATPSTLYAGTNGGGIFISLDSGANWSQSNVGLTSSIIYSLAVDPLTPTVIYAGTLAGGVFMSVDGGQSWNSRGLSGLTINAIAIDPASPATLYAATNGGAFMSTDSGATWMASNTGLGNLAVQAIAVDPQESSIRYVGVTYGGVQQSVDEIPPVLTLLGDNPMTIAQGSVYTEPGTSVTDNVDTGLEANVVVTGAVDTATVGSYVLTYDVSDAAGNAATPVSRTVNVTDQTAPVITLLGDNPMIVAHGSVFSDPGSTVSDNVDTGLTATVTGSVDTNVLGSNILTYDVTDAAGNVAVTVSRTVQVADLTAPVITLLGNNPMTVAHGSVFTDPGSTVSDNIDDGLVATVTGTVDTNAVGSYVLTYDVSDAAGNAASVTRTVNVTDQTAPVITLLGNNPMIVAQGSIFTDPGSTVSDNVDTGLVATVTGSVDTAFVGNYVLTYDVTDAAGNVAVSVSRIVTVTDQTAPVITLLGDNPMIVAHGSVFADPGSTVSDNVDTGLTATVTGTVDTATVGSYILTYKVSDAAGNATTVTRTVNVTDQTAPVISLLGTDPMTVAHGSVFTDPGSTVSDNVDTGLVATVTGTVDTATVGSYVLTYNVADAAGNVAASVTRTVNVTDQTAPVITLLGDNPMIVAHGSVFTDPGSTVSDNVDTGLIAAVGGAVDTATVGSYVLTYNVSDAAGNATTVTRTVNVTDQTAPVISLLGTDPMTVAHGSVFTDPGSAVSDNVDVGLVATVTGSVDMNMVGTYVLTYDVSDAAGNAALSVTRTVNVTDQTAPVISLLGTDPMTVAHGSLFTDPGSMVSDNVDTGLVATVIGAVDTNTLGSYVLSYDVTDAAGNVAVSVTRTVTVTDQTAPVITLLGNDPDMVAQGGTYTDPGSTVSDNIDAGLVATVTGTVDTNTVGSYVLSYEVSDAAGNATTVTRTVNVIDQTAPVITLLGSDPMTVAHGSVFTDPGSSVGDNVDVGLVATVTGTVDTNTVGTYVLTFDVSDAAGNVAASVTRTVNVTDQTAPLITLVGDNPMTVAHGSVFADPGSAVSDNVDAGLVAMVTGTVDTSTVGSYILTYEVSDAAGNASAVTRTVNVTDQTAPVITLLGASTMTVAHGSVFTDPGAVASDNVDTGLTVSVVGSVDTTAVGSYPMTHILTYSVSDAAGNAAAVVTRTVTVEDQTAPVITLVGSDTMIVAHGSVFTDPGTAVGDNVDTNLHNTVAGEVDTNTVGSYVLTYTATDSAGNAAIPVSRIVRVTDQTAPVITLLGERVITLLPGAIFTDPGSAVSDNVDSGLEATVSGTVDTNTVGTYTLTYAATDAAGNTTEVSRTVSVISISATPINGGGGAVDWASILLLLSMGLLGRRRYRLRQCRMRLSA